MAKIFGTSTFLTGPYSTSSLKGRTEEGSDDRLSLSANHSAEYTRSHVVVRSVRGRYPLGKVLLASSPRHWPTNHKINSSINNKGVRALLTPFLPPPLHFFSRL